MRRNSTWLMAALLASGLSTPAGAQVIYRQELPLDPVNLDRTANACTDFYQVANGGWLRANPLPAAYRHSGASPVIRWCAAMLPEHRSGKLTM